MKYSQAIERLEEMIGDASKGLPDEVFLFVSRLTPLVNVDLLVKDEAGRTLLTWRDDRHFGRGWHIPGGIIRYKETVAARIAAVAKKELGATVIFDPEPLLVSEYIDYKRVDRGHGISLLYACKLATPPAPELQHFYGSSPTRDQWRWHSTCPDDILEVHNIYRNFFEPRNSPDAQ